MAHRRDLGERIYRGTHFDVYRGWNGTRQVARKVPADHGANPAWFEAQVEVGGISTVWSLSFGTRGRTSHDDDDLTIVEQLQRRRYGDAATPVSSADLLESEADTLERHGRAWGHELCSFEPDSEQPVLETEWCPAVPLDSLVREQARALLPALLPALWDALVDRLHGDLSPSNLLVSPDGPRAFLIDPAAFVLRGKWYSLNAITSELHLDFVTTGSSYPLLPPWYASALALASGATLADHIHGFVRGLTLSRHAPPVAVGSSTVMHAVGPFGRPLAHSFSLEEGAPDKNGDISLRGRIHPSLQPAGEPHPADLLALGIALYGILTGRHPLGFDPDTPPAWVGLDSLDDQVEGADRLAALLERPIPAPSTLASDVTADEDRLALALLTLDIPDRDHLAELCRQRP